jgi:hypothetical protein
VRPEGFGKLKKFVHLIGSLALGLPALYYKYVWGLGGVAPFLASKQDGDERSASCP